MNHRPITIPDWFRHMAPDGALSIEEVVAMFGFPNKHALHASIQRGSFPKPDYVGGMKHATKGFTFNNRRPNWYKKTILAEIKCRSIEHLEREHAQA